MNKSEKYSFSEDSKIEFIKSIEVEELASQIPIIKIEKTEHTSLGPFVRVTQDLDSHKFIYVLAFFTKDVKSFLVDDSAFDSSGRIFIGTEEHTDISNKKQNLLCFKIVMKNDFKLAKYVDVEINFDGTSDTPKGGNNPTPNPRGGDRGTVASTPDSSID